MVVLCIVPYVVLLQLFSCLLYNNLLYKSLLFYYLLLIKSSWQGCIMYSKCYSSVPTIQLFIIQLFTIQEWTSFTPGRVYYCIVPYIVLLLPFSSLLCNNLLLIKSSWQGCIMYSRYYGSALSSLLLAGLYYFYSWQGYIKIPC